MTETEFNTLVDETFDALEMALDEVEEDPGSDLDYESAGGVLTVQFTNGTTMVFSRQPPVRQLWLAARSGGFHFEYDEAAGDWIGTRGGETFRPFVVDTMREQGGIDLAW